MDAPSLFARLNHLNRPRPPTPQENYDEATICDSALAMLSSNLLPRPLDTPHESPISDTEPNAGSSGKSAKRVTFDSTPSNIDNVENIGSTPSSEKNLSSSQPPRSILKRTGSLLSSDPVSSDPAAPVEDRDFPTMLEDMMKGLGSPEISPRFDAYLSINGCLKTYKDLPSRQALVHKMSSLTDFIRRDLAEIKASDNLRSSQLITEALRLTTTLLWSEPTRDALTQTFQSFILNHTINAVASGETSKNILNQYLFLLSTQEFGPKIMNKERANRLVGTLRGIDMRFKSKSITAHKLAIHKQCLRQDQARLVMIARARDWMDHLFKCLLSPVKELRVRAIEFGLSAGLEIGTELQVYRAFQDLFQNTNPNDSPGKTYANGVVETLTDWINAKEHSMHVPQIWSIAVLFLREEKHPFHRWEYTAIWLKVIQKCFNSSDLKLKSQANQAWTRLIYTILPNEDTSMKISSLLLSPLESQMGRFKRFDQESKDVRRITYAAYCTLLYYSLRPGTDYNTLDRYWTEFVIPIFSKTSPKPLIEPEVACRILSSLLGGSSSIVWDIGRIKNTAMLKPEEVPTLEPKWIRRRTGLVTRILDALITEDYWWRAENGDMFLKLWNCLTKAVGKAAAKEVKVSGETMGALGELTLSLCRFLDNTHGSKCDNQAFSKFCLLIQTAFDHIGSLPFTMRRLTCSVIPSLHGISKSSPTWRGKPEDDTSPLLYLLDTLLSLEVSPVQTSYVTALKLLSHIIVASSTSFVSKMKRIKELASLLEYASVHHSGSKAIFWDVIAEHVENVISQSKITSPESDLQSRYLVLQEIVDILKFGADQIKFNKSGSWFSMLDSLDIELQSIRGFASSGLFLIEPLAGYFRDALALPDSEIAIEPSYIVVSKARWPSSPRDMEIVFRKAHFSSPGLKNTASDPFDNLYSLASTLLLTAHSSRSISSDAQIAILSAIRGLFDRCPQSCFENAWKRTNQGLDVWIVDSDGVLSAHDTASQSVFKAVVDLWKTLQGKVCKVENFDTIGLQSLAPLLMAGFASRHRAIVNQSIYAWNSTFGLLNHLEYPEELRAILFRLSFETDIQLPGLCVREHDSEIESTPLKFADTPEDVDQLVPLSERLSNGISTQIPSNEPLKGTVEIVMGANAKTPEPSPLAKRTMALNHTAPRLRHDNSQIEFAVIDSSPSVLAAIESQLLTDRQEEVKERQSRETAALFPDVRSSPKPTSSFRRDSTPRLQLSQRDIIEASGGRKEPISPTLPPTDKMTPFLGSSPTPSQRSSSSKIHSNKMASSNLLDSSDVQMVDLAQDIHSSPPSIAAELLLEPPPAELEALADQVEGMQGLEHAELEEVDLPQPSTTFAMSSPSKANLSNQENVLHLCDNEDQGQSSSDKSIDAEARGGFREFTTENLQMNDSPATPGATEHNPGQTTVEMENQPCKDTIATGGFNCPNNNPDEAIGSSSTQDDLVRSTEAQRGQLLQQLLTNNIAAEGSAGRNLDPVESVGYLSDHNDLVSSQIARELESASQNAIMAPSPTAMDFEASSRVRKGHKKRGRPKRKREDPITSSQAEEVYDCITVAQPSRPPSETAQEDTQASEASNCSSAEAETHHNKSSEQDQDTARPKKRSRRSASRGKGAPGFSLSQETRRHLRSSSVSTSSSDIPVQTSRRSSQPAVRRLAAVEVNPKRRSRIADHDGESEAESHLALTGYKEKDGEHQGEHGEVHALPPSLAAGDTQKSKGQSLDAARLVTDLEALLDKAKQGIPAGECSSIMRLSMELNYVAMKAIEKQNNAFWE